MDAQGKACDDTRFYTTPDCDPYIIFKCNNKEYYRTPTKKNDPNPVLNVVFGTGVPISKELTCEFYMYDEDPRPNPDDFMDQMILEYENVDGKETTYKGTRSEKNSRLPDIHKLLLRSMMMMEGATPMILWNDIL